MTPAEAVHRLYWRGQLAAPWLPGMADYDGRREGRATGDPDLGDPATVGCLLALLREATGEPTWAVGPVLSGGALDGWRCACLRTGEEGPLAVSEGRAVAEVLLGLARGG